jgi:hypothetical protein
VANAEPYFKVDPLFSGASYARRYEILCQRLVLERKYTAACLTLATRDYPSRVSHPANFLSFRQFAAEAHAYAQAFVSSR